jgi:hypothetical protein
MRSLALALTILITAVAPAAQAADARAPLGVSNGTPPSRLHAPSATSSGDAGPGRRHERPIIVISQAIVVSPGRCWQPGYWTYQWVPQSYSYSAWVPDQWSPDGLWIAAHYEPAWYDSGYYQPFWVDGYWLGC